MFPGNAFLAHISSVLFYPEYVESLAKIDMPEVFHFRGTFMKNGGQGTLLKDIYSLN